MMNRKLAILQCASPTKTKTKRAIVTDAISIMDHDMNEYPVMISFVDELVRDGLLIRENLEGYSRSLRGTNTLAAEMSKLQTFVQKMVRAANPT